MKNRKLAAMLLITAMTLSMTACGGKTANNTATNKETESVESNTTENTEDDFGGFGEDADDSFGVGEETETEGVDDVVKPDVTLGQELEEQFKTEVVNDTDIESLAKKLASNKGLDGVSVDVASVEEGWLEGFDEDITGFTKGYTFRPVIGTIPFVGYVFELDNEKSAESFVDTLNNKANLNWNICTSADEMVITRYDNIVLCVMSPYTFEE